MSLNQSMRFLKEHKWWAAAVLIVVAGYTLGKDRALRDNARDAAAISAGTEQ